MPSVLPTELNSFSGLAKVLIVDDRHENLVALEAVLEPLGEEIVKASSGEEALRQVLTDEFAVILMDAQMPDIDGVEATRRIREAQAAGDPSFPSNLTIVAMTANAMTGDREICLAAGMDDYLAKPVKSGDLRKILERYLSRDLTTSDSTN